MRANLSLFFERQLNNISFGNRVSDVTRYSSSGDIFREDALSKPMISRLTTRDENFTVMTSPCLTSFAGFASWPFTSTLPAMHISCATVLRFTSRLVFRNRSRRTQAFYRKKGGLTISITNGRKTREWFPVTLQMGYDQNPIPTDTARKA